MSFLDSPTVKKMETDTDLAFKNPRAGQRFHEMYSFWMYVLFAKHNLIIGMETCPNTKSGWKLFFLTTEDYIKRFSYGSIPGYWVDFSEYSEKLASESKELILNLLQEENSDLSTKEKNIIRAIIKEN